MPQYTPWKYYIRFSRFNASICVTDFSSIPVWGALQCHSFPPWGSSCSGLSGQPGCQTSHRHLRHTWRPPKDGKTFQSHQQLLWGVPYIVWLMNLQISPFDPLHQLCRLQMIWNDLSHLVANPNMGNLGLAVHVLLFLLIGENREHEVSQGALALPYQKAASFAFFWEHFLCISAREAPVVPPGEEGENLIFMHENRDKIQRETNYWTINIMSIIATSKNNSKMLRTLNLVFEK